MNIEDGYRFDMALSGFSPETMRHWTDTVGRACNFIYGRLGNPANLEWMENKRHERFNGMTFNDIRNQWDMRKMDEITDLLLSGRIEL